MKHGTDAIKRLLILLLIPVLLLPAAALADPLPLLEDLADTITVLYDPEDPEAGSYVYSYRYPYADPEEPTAYLINSYYEYLVRDTRDYTVPNLADYYAARRQSVRVDITYEITCTNDEFFSVRLRQTEDQDGEITELWKGNTFSRLKGMPGSVISLPHLLGTLRVGESDNWLENRQAEKARQAVYNLVWEIIKENADHRAYYPDLTREELEMLFDPQEDFWLDESENFVFFIQPGQAAAAEEGLITFLLTYEEIDDEI